jgi:uncharacterized protein (TIGR04552 family)
MVEFQIIDQETALNNESGESAHHLYKQRQIDQVLQRLKKGGPNSLMSPRKSK